MQTKSSRTNQITISLLVFLSVFFATTTALLTYNQFFGVVGNQNSIVRRQLLNILNSEYVGQPPTPEQIEEGELKGLVWSLEDPYTTYLPKEETQEFEDAINQRYQGIGVRFDEGNEGVIVEEVFEGSPAQKSGVKTGDVLKKVEGTDVSDQEISDIADKIRGPKDTSVQVTFERDKELKDFSITRDKISTELVKLDVKENVGIITISSFGEGMDEKMKAIAKQIYENNSIKKIIVDVRGNGGGLLNEAVDLISYFSEPNEVIVSEKSKKEEKTLRSSLKEYSLANYPTLVLIDKNSASASEILAGSLKDNSNVKLVGQKTFGKGTVQQLFVLNNEAKLRITVAEWFTPNGSAINKKGIEPDIKVPADQDSLTVALEEIKKI